MSELRSPKAATAPQASAPKSSAVTLCSAPAGAGPTPSRASAPSSGASSAQRLGSRPAAAMAALGPARPQPPPPRLTAAVKHRAAAPAGALSRPPGPAAAPGPSPSPRGLPSRRSRGRGAERGAPRALTSGRRPRDSVARGGGACRRVDRRPGGGGPDGGPSAMAGAAGLMAEVSRTVLEQRARAKRSGLRAGAPPPRAPGAGVPGSRRGAVPAVGPQRAAGGPAFRPSLPSGNEGSPSITRMCPQSRW